MATRPIRTERSQLSTPVMILVSAIAAVVVIGLLIMITERDNAPTAGTATSGGDVVLEDEATADVTPVASEAEMAEEDVSDEAGVAEGDENAPDDVVVVDDAEDGSEALENTEGTAVVTDDPSEGVQEANEEAPANGAADESTEATEAAPAEETDPAESTDPSEGDSSTIVVPLTDPDAATDDETTETQ